MKGANTRVTNVIRIVAAIVIADWIFKSGKRAGSRKGYGVGRSDGRRRR